MLRAPKSHNNVVSFVFKAIDLLPKYLRFKCGGARLVSFLGRNLTSYALLSRRGLFAKIPYLVLAPELIFFRS